MRLLGQFGMGSMFGRLVEKMIRGSKPAADDGYLSHYLNAVCPSFAPRYLETIRINSAAESTESLDALDVLAQLIMEEQNIQNADISASRAYLSILIDNEHLPAQSQLSESELQTLRELLFCYFSGAENTNEKGSQVLSLIERKFANGNFSQARILLQIFETNNETRQNNERNLYYEEMIMRLEYSPSKSKPLPALTIKEATASDADDETVLHAFSELEQIGGIKFCLYLRDPDEYERWENSLQTLSEDVRQYLLDYVPIIRWRKLGSLTGSLMSQFGMHMTFEMLRRHVQQKLRMCYFILLANGNTGYEWFIFAFAEWSRRVFEVDIREVFPMLHRSGIIDGMCLQEVLDVTIDRFYGKKMNDIAITPEALEKAYRESVQFIMNCDISQIASGCYNFGDFLLDRILQFDYKSPMFAFQLHSMM